MVRYIYRTIRMPPRSRINSAKTAISDYLASQSKSIFTPEELSHILEENREKWNLPLSVSTGKLIGQMEDAGLLEGLRVEFKDGREILRYAFKKPSIYDVGLSLFPRSYISHHSAAYLHGLLDESRNLLYLTHEQSEKHLSAGGLTQQAIDAAFHKPQRISGQYASWGGYRIQILNGKNVHQAGVVEHVQPGLSLTALERTLVDLAVRPAYGGGAAHVLTAYQKAIEQNLSVAGLVELLDVLDFIYPYHQAVGYYLDRAGYRDSDISLLKNKPMPFDFYLDYAMSHMVYIPTWKIYVPKQIA